MSGRVLRAQRDVIARFRRIANLYVAYTNSDRSPEEFGREFVVAVGEIMEGKTIDQLELFHIDVSEIEDVVAHGRQEVLDDPEGAKRSYHQPLFLHGRMRRG